MATLALRAAAGSCLSDGRSWPKCEVPTGAENVYYRGQTGHTAHITNRRV